MAEKGKTDGRYNKGIAHHEFPTKINTSTSPEAKKARDLLADIGFNIESTGSKTVLFANSETGKNQIIAGVQGSLDQRWRGVECSRPLPGRSSRVQRIRHQRFGSKESFKGDGYAGQARI